MESRVSFHMINAHNLSSLLKPVKEDLILVEKLLAENLIDSTPFVTQLIGQVFESGGKRIRPAVTILASKASAKDREIGRLHIMLAALTELIHTASLVHDDVIDHSLMRRGNLSINKRYSDRLAVLVGDLLFASASICLARIMNPVIVGIYGQVLGDLCAGEISQMQTQNSTYVDWDGYIHKSICKTASLFSAGTLSSAILNAAPDIVAKALKEYGLNLGICFQIMDDLLDIIGVDSELGKKPGSDLKAGILTAPYMFVLERNDEPAQRLAHLIKTRAVSEESGQEEALELVRTYGGIEATIKLACRYAQASARCLSALPPSVYRDSLSHLPDYIIERTS